MHVEVKVIGQAASNKTIEIDGKCLVKELSKHITNFPVYKDEEIRYISETKVLNPEKPIMDEISTTGDVVVVLITSIPKTKTFTECLLTLKENCTTKEECDIAFQTLEKIGQNILQHPHEEKYRQIRLQNATMKRRLLTHSGGIDCLLFFGFERIDDKFILTPTAERWENLVQRTQELAIFLSTQ